VASAESDRVIRPAAIVPEREARMLMAWVAVHDVTHGGVWAHDVGYFKRFSGPFDGLAGMRGSAVLLGTIHVTWDKYDVTIFRVSVTDEGAARALTVESLCNELLVHAGLTLATCPRADLAPAPVPDPFKRPTYADH
jgi:hypothetical protein